MKLLEPLFKEINRTGILDINVKITPGAFKTEIFSQLADGTLKIRVQDPPENNQANKTLIKLLEKTFQADALILSGDTQPKKRIRLILK